MTREERRERNAAVIGALISITALVLIALHLV